MLGDHLFMTTATKDYAKHVALRMKSRMEFEDGFNFDSDSAGQGICTECTARSHAKVFAENIAKQFAATVDDGRLVFKIVRATYQSQELDQAGHSI
jgi:hypothetical protein